MFSTKSKQLPRPWTPITDELKLDTYDILNYRSNDIADELTLINRTLLLQIKPEELFSFAFLATEKETLAPNVTLMLEFYERTSALFATQILRQKTDKLRASVITHLFSTRTIQFIKLRASEANSEQPNADPIVRQLYIKNHDIHSIRIILAAFDHPSIFRLLETWRLFRLQKPKFYIALKYLWNVLSQENNWDDYLLWLEQKFIKDCLNKNQPMLLFIGYLLSKMVIDRYRYFQISTDHQEKISNDNDEISSPRVNLTLIEYIKSSPKSYK